MSEQGPTCPECDEDDEYTVDVVYSAGGQFQSGHSPWDEPGTAHHGGDSGSNRVTYFKCSNGHRWAEEQ